MPERLDLASPPVGAPAHFKRHTARCTLKRALNILGFTRTMKATRMAET